MAGWWYTYPSEEYEFVSWDYNRAIDGYSLVIWYSLLLKIAIEIVDLPIEHGDFP